MEKTTYMCDRIDEKKERKKHKDSAYTGVENVSLIFAHIF